MLASCLASSILANSTTLLAAPAMLFILSFCSASWAFFASRAACVWTRIIARLLANADFWPAPLVCLWLLLRRGFPFSKDRDRQSWAFVGVVPEADSVKLTSSLASNSLFVSYVCENCLSVWFNSCTFLSSAFNCAANASLVKRGTVWSVGNVVA